MRIMYFVGSQTIKIYTKMSKKQKMSPWKWFFTLWFGSLFLTAFIAYSLKLFLKWIS